MTTPICTHGFRCPYRAMGEEELICIFPYLPTSPGIEDEEFGLLYDMSMMDCPLNENVEDDELEMLLWAYDTPDIREFIEKRYADELERYEEAVKRREEQKKEVDEWILGR